MPEPETPTQTLDPKTLPQTLGELETTLDELFDRDPNQHTPEERALILLALRGAKETWFTAERDAKAAGKQTNWRKAGSPNPKTMAARAKLIAEDADIDIDGLLGDLDL